MKIVVAVVWYTTASRMRRLLPILQTQVDLIVYSARALSSGEEDSEALFRDLEQADIAIFTKTQTDGIWVEVEDYLKKKPLLHAYVGSDALSYMEDEKTLEISAKCNEYYTRGGESQQFGSMCRASCR